MASSRSTWAQTMTAQPAQCRHGTRREPQQLHRMHVTAPSPDVAVADLGSGELATTRLPLPAGARGRAYRRRSARLLGRSALLIDLENVCPGSRHRERVLAQMCSLLRLAGPVDEIVAFVAAPVSARQAALLVEAGIPTVGVGPGPNAAGKAIVARAEQLAAAGTTRFVVASANRYFARVASFGELRVISTPRVPVSKALAAAAHDVRITGLRSYPPDPPRKATRTGGGALLTLPTSVAQGRNGRQGGRSALLIDLENICQGSRRRERVLAQLRHLLLFAGPVDEVVAFAATPVLARQAALLAAAGIPAVGVHPGPDAADKALVAHAKQLAAAGTTRFVVASADHYFARVAQLGQLRVISTPDHPVSKVLAAAAHDVRITALR